MVSLYRNFPGPRHLPFNARKWNSKDLTVFCWAPFDWRIKHLRDSKGIMGKDSCKSIIQHGPISVGPNNRNASIPSPRRPPPTPFASSQLKYHILPPSILQLHFWRILFWTGPFHICCHIPRNWKGLKTSTHRHHMFPSMSLCKCFTCSGLDSKGCRAATWDIKIKSPWWR